MHPGYRSTGNNPMRGPRLFLPVGGASSARGMDLLGSSMSTGKVVCCLGWLGCLLFGVARLFAIWGVKDGCGCLIVFF